MNMEKRVLLAFVLVLLYLVVYSSFFMRKAPQEERTDVPPREAIEERREDAEIPYQAAKPVTLSDSVSQVKPLQSAEQITIRTELLAVTFTTRGGSISSIDLPGYQDNEGEAIALESELFGLTFSPGIEGVLRNSFMVTGIGTTMVLFDKYFTKKEYDDPYTIGFEYELDDRVRIEKVFHVIPEDYQIECTLSIENRGERAFDLSDGYEVSCGTLFPLKATGRDRAYLSANGLLAKKDALTKIKLGRLEREEHKENGFIWAGISNKYFTKIVRGDVDGIGLIARKIKYDRAGKEVAGGQASLVMPSLFLKSGERHQAQLLLYAGPREYDRLKTAGYRFETVMGFTGIIGSISLLVLKTLNFFYRLVNNYGIAIILLTFVVRIILFPLTHKSFKSMKQLQAVQPLANEIRQRHKDNPRKMQEETMALYKKHKVNPLGGCLPMLLQIPILFALFNTFRRAIELKGASFLWMKDLSEPDTIAYIGGLPVNILPLVMGVTMVWQQKLTPSTSTDPSQQKIMMIMPIMFTFIFYSFPSGLVLYWLISNVLGIIQQYHIKKSI